MATLINLTEGMRFGVGIEGITEEARGTAIQYDGVSNGSGGQIVNSQVKLIESQESLMESMQLSVSASVRYGLVSGDAKFSLARLYEVQNKPELARDNYQDVERESRFSSKGIEAGMRIEDLIRKYPKLAPVNPSPVPMTAPPIMLTNLPAKPGTNSASGVTNK